jgi:hypothetical protein
MSSSTLSPALSPARTAEVLTTIPGTRLLDVRTPGGDGTAHIAGAYNVPLDTFAEHAREIRSVRDPIAPDGGMNGRIAAGQPVVRGPKRLSLERRAHISGTPPVSVSRVPAPAPAPPAATCGTDA